MDANASNCLIRGVFVCWIQPQITADERRWTQINQFGKRAKSAQAFSVFSAYQNGGFAAAKNLRLSASICG